MEITIRADSVEITGYVNVIERASKILRSRTGNFIERIKKGAFKRAIEKNGNIRALLNHDDRHDLGGTNDGSLELREDSVGLHARLITRDAETIQKARNRELVGWSFGFFDVPDGVTEGVEDGVKLRNVKDLDLREVSVLDNTRNPAYEGTLLEVRDDAVCLYGETVEDELIVREEQPEEKEPEKEPEQPSAEPEKVAIDYSKYEELIKQLKGESGC